jgi:hypothetical protein
MGYFSDVQLDILDMYSEGVEPQRIAEILELPVEEVLAVLQADAEGDIAVEDEWDDSYADAEALASAGFGTDEDYGYYGDDY